jgi:hypothetical protein
VVEPDADGRARQRDGDAHRLRTQEHNWAAILSQVAERQSSNGYTVPYRGQTSQIPPSQVRTGRRGSQRRGAARRAGSMAMHFKNEYLRVEVWETPKRVTKPKAAARPRRVAPRKSRWREGFFARPARRRERAIAIAHATSGRTAKAGAGAPGQHRPPVFALTGPKPPLGRLHQNDRNTAKDPRGFSPSRVSTDHSGASPVASAGGVRWGATLHGHHPTNTHC